MYTNIRAQCIHWPKWDFRSTSVNICKYWYGKIHSTFLFQFLQCSFTVGMASPCHGQWAILSPARGHTYICSHTQETALAEDRIGFMNQWPCGSYSDTEAGDASFPLCRCDTSRDLGVSGREEHFSNLLKDSCKLWLIAWNFTSSKHAQMELTATHKELEDVW